ncbi:MAG TPA: response regulator transcription factor [Chthoniobacterales bacterium]|nr:response regulator transcription factor [Chthoniobacterales bacterium]
MNTIRVLVADDHEVVREGVRALIDLQADLEVCGLAATGREAVDLARQTKPDVVVLDLTMPELDGLEAIRQIRKALPETEVLVFSAHSSEEIVEDVFDAGAKSYIEKSEASRDLLAAIRSLAEHKPFFTSEASEILFSKFLLPQSQRERERAEQKLTARESEIVRLLAQSSSNKDIATALGISIRTVETHRATLMRKLRIHSVAGLVRYAIRRHIIEP